MKTVHAPDTAAAYLDALQSLGPVAGPVVAILAAVVVSAYLATLATKYLG